MDVNLHRAIDNDQDMNYGSSPMMRWFLVSLRRTLGRNGVPKVKRGQALQDVGPGLKTFPVDSRRLRTSWSLIHQA